MKKGNNGYTQEKAWLLRVKQADSEDEQGMSSCIWGCLTAGKISGHHLSRKNAARL